MKQLVPLLERDYPDVTFVAGTVFSWSPSQQSVYYISNSTETSAVWSLLHELGHALCQHKDFSSDLTLLKMEVEAWAKAKELASRYGHTIEEDHIQDCLDTYRDWLHQRSTCPTCASVSLQKDSSTYRCHNCNEQWQVAQNRHCRPYRMTTKQKQPV